MSEQTTTEFLDVILNGLTLGKFLGYMFLMLIGVAINAFIKVSERESIETPKKFSFKFFIADNYKKWCITILVIYLCIRFSDKMFTSGEPVDWIMIVLGYNADHVVDFIKNRTSALDADRKKFVKDEERQRKIEEQREREYEAAIIAEIEKRVAEIEEIRKLKEENEKN